MTAPRGGDVQGGPQRIQLHSERRGREEMPLGIDKLDLRI
jgi:hypothetical protein